MFTLYHLHNRNKFVGNYTTQKNAFSNKLIDFQFDKHHNREDVATLSDLIMQMRLLTHFILETPKGVLAKSGDPDQMPHNVASDLGLHYFASCSAIFQQKYIN